MNALFLAGLTLFFAQGALGRDRRSAKTLAATITLGLFAATLKFAGVW